MIRSFRYPLKPTRAQERVLLQWLVLTRELYNAALQERKEAWSKQHKKIERFDQNRQLPELRKLRPEYATIPSDMQRGALSRIDNAFKDFFRRCKRGVKPGYPRFRSARRWRSLVIDSPERARVGKLFVAGGSRIAIPILGKVKIKMHRPVEGRVMSMKIVHDIGKWYVCFACDGVQPKPLPPTGHDVGVDMGIKTFAATSDGELFENPKPFGRAKLALARAIRRMHKKRKGSSRRRKMVIRLAKKHACVANIRRENHITVARSLVANYDVIYIEALILKGMVASAFAKNMRDVAVGNFFNWLRVKAEDAAREVIEVSPRGTSQTCPGCGAVAKKTIKEREHVCACGLVGDRDVVAAQIILERGRRLRRDAVLVEARRRPAEIEFADEKSSTSDR